VIKVAVEAYEIGKLNKYDHPEYLFVGGLFHDVHRPAEGEDGEEDQYLSLKITIDLFYKANIPASIATKVLHAIESHDNWRGRKQIPQFDLLLSTADKAAMSPIISYGYVWASNKYSAEKIGKPIYTSHLQLIYAFLKYQQRAWEIFIKHPVKGTERAINAYLDTNEVLFENFKKQKTEKQFFAYVEALVETFRAEETRYIKHFTKDKNSVGLIMKRCY